MLGKIMVLTLSDTEDYVVEKILSLLSNERILIKSNVSNHDELHFNKLTIYPSFRSLLLTHRFRRWRYFSSAAKPLYLPSASPFLCNSREILDRERFRCRAISLCLSPAD